MKTLKLIICIMLLTATFACKTNDKNGKTVNEINKSYIDKLISEHFVTDTVPGFALLAMKNGEVIYEKTMGLTNIKTKDKFTPNSCVRLASITKHMTALSVLILAERKLIDLDTSLTVYFDEFPPLYDSITPRMLIYHTSGILDYQSQSHNFPPDKLERLFSGEEQLSEKDIVNLVAQTDSTYFNPGTEFRYSNTGYILLAEIVKRISGKSFPEFMKQNIYEPLEMDSTFVYTLDANIPNRAVGHSKNEKGWVITDQNYSSGLMGDGGVYSTLNDLKKWYLFLTKRKQLFINNETFVTYLSEGFWGNGSKLILPKPENLDTTDTKPLLLPYSYGYGLEFANYNNKQFIFHGGASIGFRNMMLFYPEEEIFVVLLTNRNEMPRLIDSLFGHFLK